MTEQNRAAAALRDQQAAMQELPPHLVAQFAEMAMALPETESDGGAGIIEAILNAVDVKATNKIWDARDIESLSGVSLVIESASRSISDYKGGLGVFLVVQAVREDTGEPVTFTTGSLSVVAQIVKAWAGEELPLRCTPTPADRPAKSGYVPWHLTVADNQPQR